MRINYDDVFETTPCSLNKMITARRSFWFEKVFRIYNRNLLARRFEGLRVAGLDGLRRTEAGLPLMLYANHSSWWDGLVAFEVGISCGLEHFVMMEEKQLRAYPLFRRLGAFSIVRENMREARRSIEYAADLLRDAEGKDRVRALWLFPQGVTRPNATRPLDFYTGTAHIAKRLERVALLPVAMRYEHLGEFRPEIFVRVGTPEVIGAGQLTRGSDLKQLTHYMEESLTRTLDRVRADILAENYKDYAELVAPRRRVSGAAQ